MNANELEHWLEVAKHDADTAKLIIDNNGHADIGIYHIHQAVEKLLKAIFVFDNKNPPKIHHLDQLLNMLIDRHTQLIDISKDIITVDSYLPKLRYPVSEKLDDSDLLKCWTSFNAIQNALMIIITNKKR